MCGTCWQLVANIWDFFITQVWRWFRRACRGGWIRRALCRIARFVVAVISTIVGFILSVILGIICLIVCALCFILWAIVCVLNSLFTDQKCPPPLDTCMTVFGSARPGGSSSGLFDDATPTTGSGTGTGVAGGGSGLGPRMVVTEVKQLRALSVWRGVLTGRPVRVALDLTGMSAESLQHWQARLNRYLSSCGCVEGGLSLLSAGGIYGAYVLATATPVSWRAIGTGVITAVLAGILGKATGVLRAELLLARDRRQLVASLTPLRERGRAPRLALFTLVITSGLAACTGPSITPGSLPAALSKCPTPSTFSMTVERGNTTRVVSLTRGYLVANGELLPMAGPGGGPWGQYTYSGPVPYDGEVRFRYMFRYTSGVGGGSDHVIYAPDRYTVRPMEQLTWTTRSPANTSTPLPDDAVDPVLYLRPRRYVMMQDVLPSGVNFTGTRTQTADLVIHNGFNVPVSISGPSIVDRQTGAPIPGLSIAHLSSGLTTGYVVTVQPGANDVFRISAQTTITNSQPVFWEAGVKFVWQVGAPCWFGPIWVDVGFLQNAP